MNYMIIGMLLFFGPHLMAGVPKLRATNTKLSGENAYKGIYSLLSLSGLILMGYGKSIIPFEHVYAPVVEMRQAMALFMWVAFFLLAASSMPGNIKRFTRHPMLWGISIWASAHLLVNGDLGSIILFGSFLIFSLWAMVSANVRGAKKSTQKLPITKDAIIATGSLVVTLAAMYGHQWLSGIRLI